MIGPSKSFTFSTFLFNFGGNILSLGSSLRQLNDLSYQSGVYLVFLKLKSALHRLNTLFFFINWTSISREISIIILTIGPKEISIINLTILSREIIIINLIIGPKAISIINLTIVSRGIPIINSFTHTPFHIWILLDRGRF